MRRPVYKPSLEERTQDGCFIILWLSMAILSLGVSIGVIVLTAWLIKIVVL